MFTFGKGGYKGRTGIRERASRFSVRRFALRVQPTYQVKLTMIHALLLLVGLVLMSIAGWQFRQTMKLLKNGERTKARVLELVASRSRRCAG